MGLAPKDWTKGTYKWRGYERVEQLGQYFSVTIDEETTRLYTTVHCMRSANRKIMEQISVFMKRSQGDSD